MILVNLLKKLSTRERTKFQNSLHLPFSIKTRKFSNSLVSYWLSHRISTQSESTKQLIYKAIYGKGPYEELRLNNLISDLVQLLYDYLSYSQLEHRRREKALLLEALKLEDYIANPRQAKRYQKIQEKQPYRNQTYFWILSCYTKNWISFHCPVEREGMMWTCNSRTTCWIPILYL